jgi:hybrid cluster-associated redox disulfide protein
MEEQIFVTKDMTIGEIIDMYPDTIEIILEYGLHCVGCGISGFETIEQGAMSHGMSSDDVEMSVRDLNKIIIENQIE